MPKAAKRGTVRWHKENIKALDESIAHWRRLRDFKQKDGEKPDYDWCACCKLDDLRSEASPDYFPSVCLSCPVYDFTDEEACNGTPIRDASDAWRRSMEAGDVKSADRELMHAEVSFLVKVRRAEYHKLKKLRAKRQGS